MRDVSVSDRIHFAVGIRPSVSILSDSHPYDCLLTGGSTEDFVFMFRLLSLVSDRSFLCASYDN